MEFNSSVSCGKLTLWNNFTNIRNECILGTYIAMVRDVARMLQVELTWLTSTLEPLLINT